MPEAYPLSEFDVEAVKNGLEAAIKAESASVAADDVTKATAQIQVKTYSALARALGLNA